ncbi:MAG: TerB family tellurite resistance protein [Rhodothermales bacterium]|nr:TerB family tellurite resistance protein [Rhodothermales bacterium]
MRFKKVEGWMELHEMALLFIALAHGTDHELAPAEIETGTRLLGKWAPESPESVVKKTLCDVMLAYIAPERDQLIALAAESLRQTLSPNERLGILNDLTDLAYADGKLLPLEVSFIQQLASYWGLTTRARGQEDAAKPARQTPGQPGDASLRAE